MQRLERILLRVYLAVSTRIRVRIYSHSAYWLDVLSVSEGIARVALTASVRRLHGVTVLIRLVGRDDNMAFTCPTGVLVHDGDHNEGIKGMKQSYVASQHVSSMTYPNADPRSL